jgi:hypothetical protein
MGKDKRDTLIIALVLVIAAFLLAFAFLFVVNPAISGMVTQQQNQGYAYAILSVMQKAATCQQVPLTAGNQTIHLIAVECLQPQAQPSS